jgi:hypothetical protein
MIFCSLTTWTYWPNRDNNESSLSLSLAGYITLIMRHYDKLNSMIIDDSKHHCENIICMLNKRSNLLGEWTIEWLCSLKKRNWVKNYTVSSKIHRGWMLIVESPVINRSFLRLACCKWNTLSNLPLPLPGSWWYILLRNRLIKLPMKNIILTSTFLKRDRVSESAAT